MRAGHALVLGTVAALVIAACDVIPFAPAGPVGGPQVVCQAVPETACRLAVDSLSSDDRAVRVVVRCTAPVCTDADGEADVTFQFADGRSEFSDYGWTTAPEPAGVPEPPPVPHGS